MTTLRSFRLLAASFLASGLLAAPLITGLGAALAPSPAAAAADKGKSGLPLPRFVSLKASRVNMRVGPGRDYSVDWMFTKRGLPLEILQEYDNWRKVRDSDGSEGWILQTLLTGKRTALISPWLKEEGGMVELHAKPEANSPVVAKMEAGVLAEVRTCVSGWCEIRAKDWSGYAKQVSLWGVYPDEKID